MVHCSIVICFSKICVLLTSKKNSFQFYNKNIQVAFSKTSKTDFIWKFDINRQHAGLTMKRIPIVVKIATLY